MARADSSTAAVRARSLGALVVASGFGAGWSPIAPGTAGSAVGLVLFWPLARAAPAVQLGAVLLVYLVGVAASSVVARERGCKDPALVVVDEVCGIWASLVGLPFTPLTVGLAFVLFRVLDIFKPYPARDLEDLPGGWGIMSDDLVAGVYTNVAVRAVLLALAAG